MAGPTTPILDNFNRANEGPPPSSSWTSATLAGDGTYQLKVVSNQCVSEAIADNTYGENAWSTNPGANCEAYATIATMPTDNMGVFVSLRCKEFGTTTADGYSFGRVQRAVADDNRIYRVDNGVFTVIAVVTEDFAAGDGILGRVTGSYLELEKRASGVWSLLVSFTDTTYPAAGAMVLSIEGPTGIVDDFGGGTVVETGPAVAGVFVGGADIMSGPTYAAFQYNAFQASAFQSYNAGGGTAYNETGAAIAGAVASGNNTQAMSDGGAGIAGGVAAGSDAQAMSDGGAGVAGAVIGGAEVMTYADSGVGIAGADSYGADVFAASDGGYGLAGAVASGAEQFTGGGGTAYNETGAGHASSEASGYEVMTYADSGVSVAGAVASGLEGWVMSDTGAADVGADAYAADAFGMADGGAGLLGAIPSGADVLAMLDSGYALAGAVASGAEQYATAGTAARVDAVRQAQGPAGLLEIDARQAQARPGQVAATARQKGVKAR